MAKQQLDQQHTDAQGNLNSELLAHLQGCPDCQAYREELALIRLVASQPAPPLSAGFADRALARAWKTAEQQQQASRTKPYTWGAIAASLVLVAVFGTQTLQMGTTPSPAEASVVQVLPAQHQPLEIRLVSKEALPDAHIHVHWDKDVALTGYPDTDTLSWQVPIAAGINQISLPVTLRGAHSGSMVIEVRSGDASKQLRITLEPAQLAAATVARYYASL